MTVEEAQRVYAEWSRTLVLGHQLSDPEWQARNPVVSCFACSESSRRVDAVSIALDLAVSIAHPSPTNLVDYIRKPHAGVAY